MKDEIVVYFNSHVEKKDFYEYNDNFIKKINVPKKVINNLRENKTNIPRTFFQCPATKNLYKNIYYCETIEDMKIEMNDELLNIFLNVDFNNFQKYEKKTNGINLHPIRSSNINNHFAARLSQNYLIISEEPLNIKLTAPNFPSVSPAPYSLLASGQFNIGRWPRTLALEYHFRNETDTIEFKKGDPLVFFEFETDKKIIFKKFKLNEKIVTLSKEIPSIEKISNFKNLTERYEMADRMKISKRLIEEIKNNLV